MAVITQAKVKTFLDESKVGSVLCCGNNGLQMVKKKDGGSWRLRYSTPNGQRRVITIGDASIKPKQAIDRANQILVNVMNGSDPLYEKQQLKEVLLINKNEEEKESLKIIRYYLENDYKKHQSSKKNEGKHSLTAIRCAFDYPNDYPLLDKKMDAITQRDITEWQNLMYQRGKQHATVVRAYGALKTMINYALRHDVVSENPLLKTRLNPEPVDLMQKRKNIGVSTKRKILSNNEVSSLIKGMKIYSEKLVSQRENTIKHGNKKVPSLKNLTYPSWVIPFTYISLFTGLRPGDTLSLKWHSELNVIDKKLIKTPSKTLHHPDPIEIRHAFTDKLNNVVQAWFEQSGSPKSGYVFPSDKSPLVHKYKSSYNTAWKEILKFSGLDPNLDFYTLRHHFISSLVTQGVPLLAVAHLVGHKSTKMIEKHYGHLCPVSAVISLDTFANNIDDTFNH